MSPGPDAQGNSDALVSDVAIALSYYAPYVSGLTNVVRDIAGRLAARGRRVTVITSQHDPKLPREEVLNGVRVLRAPVALRLGKGVICPGFLGLIRRESAQARVLNIHAPMLEAGPAARLSRAPVVLTYHCDVNLGAGPAAWLQERVIDRSTLAAARAARCVTVSSDDYAEHCRLAAAFAGKRVTIPPPCHERPGGVPRFRKGAGLHIGFLGRFVAEKGIGTLVEGFRAFAQPDARLLLAGDFTAVAGGSVIGQLRGKIAGDPRIDLLGFLPEHQLADFYASLDAFALPSINSLEAFGIVQVEAMMRGIRVLASDLPGVRQPSRETGLGLIIEPGSPRSITNALERLAQWHPDAIAGAAKARDLYGVDAVADKYDALFQSIAAA